MNFIKSVVCALFIACSFNLYADVKRPTATPRPKPTPHYSVTPKPTATATVIATPTLTPTPTVTPTIPPSPTPTPTATVIATATVTPTATSTATPTSTILPSPSPSPTATATNTPTATATATSTFTPTSTATFTPTVTATSTQTPTATATFTSPTPTPSTIPNHKSWPGGIIVLMQTDKLNDPVDLSVYAPALVKPFVSMSSYRGAWNNIEPQHGVFNWNKIDEAIAQASAQGKRIGIGIGCGLFTPQWVYDDFGIQKYILHDPNAGGGGMPIPWRLDYQVLLFEYIDALAERYENNPNVVWTKIGGFMEATLQALGDLVDETNLDAIAKQDGYNDIRAAYDDASRKIIDHWGQKFPTTTLLLMTIRVFPDSLGTTLMTDARDYGETTYAPRFGDQPGNGLRATLPPHIPMGGTPPPFPKIAQAFSDTAKPGCVIYVPPVPIPCPVNPQATDDLIKAGAVEKLDWGIEMYVKDILDAANQDVLTDGAILLENNMALDHLMDIRFVYTPTPTPTPSLSPRPWWMFWKFW